MKKAILYLICSGSLLFANNITFNDVDWIINPKENKCDDVRESGFGGEVIKMVNGQGYALNYYSDKYHVREFTDGKLNYWMFPDKDSCESFMKTIMKK